MINDYTFNKSFTNSILLFAFLCRVFLVKSNSRWVMVKEEDIIDIFITCH